MLTSRKIHLYIARFNCFRSKELFQKKKTFLYKVKLIYIWSLLGGISASILGQQLPVDVTQNRQHPFSGFCIEHLRKNYMKTEPYSQEIISFQTNYKQALWQVHYKPFCTLDLLNFFNTYCENYMRKRKKKISLGEFYYWSNKQVTQFLEIDLDLGVLATSKGASIYFFTRISTDFFSVKR